MNALSNHLNRGKNMGNIKRWILLGVTALIVFFIAACSGSDDEGSEGEGSSNSSGGQLNIALNAQPPTLDPQVSTATATRDTARMVFESVMVLNADFEPVPFLAEEVENVDNQLFTFHLKEGILFHNGDEMKAEDVVASMNRWKELSNKGKSLIGEDEFVEIDEYTVQLELTEPSSLLLTAIAESGQFAAIMPKEINEAAGPDGVTEYIGTGPFEFGEWQQDNYIHFTKFDDYTLVDEEPDGLAGRKEALVDDIYFYIAEDASTRQAGIQSGEYDIAYSLPFDSYQQLLTTDLQVDPAFAGDMVLQYNARAGLMSDEKMRQAVNAALNIDEILQAALVDPEIYEANATLMQKENLKWATNAGEEYYNMNDENKAKELLEEAGYDGEVVKLISTRDYQHYYDSSVVIKEQLEKIGMSVDLEVYDWPTLTDLIKDEDAWHMRVNGFTFKADPTQILYLDPNSNGMIEDERISKAMKFFDEAEDEAEAKAEWESLQEYLWAELLPVTKLGSYVGLYALGENVDGFIYSHGAQFWNVSGG